MTDRGKPEIARIIAEFPCPCGKVKEIDNVDVFKTEPENYLRSSDQAGGGVICTSCACGRQWNYHLATRLKEGGIVETRVYLRLTKDLEPEPKPKGKGVKARV